MAVVSTEYLSGFGLGHFNGGNYAGCGSCYSGYGYGDTTAPTAPSPDWTKIALVAALGIFVGLKLMKGNPAR